MIVATLPEQSVSRQSDKGFMSSIFVFDPMLLNKGKKALNYNPKQECERQHETELCLCFPDNPDTIMFVRAEPPERILVFTPNHNNILLCSEALLETCLRCIPVSRRQKAKAGNTP